jgi:helix-turn-helix, Psq domain.
VVHPKSSSYSSSLSCTSSLDQVQQTQASPASFLQPHAWKALQMSKSANSKWTQDDLLAAIELVKQGTPIKPAAEKCNIPVMTLWRRTRALGVISSRASCNYRYGLLPQESSDPDPSITIKEERFDGFS